MLLRKSGDTTGKTLSSYWPGTVVLVTIKIEENTGFILTKIMQEFRDEAVREQVNADKNDIESTFYVNINNHFGIFAEDKESAIKFRDKKLFPAINEGKEIKIDFENVISAPHSFLSGLFASPIKSLGISAYKRLKFINTKPEIRETIDFIFDDNT